MARQDSVLVPVLFLDSISVDDSRGIRTGTGTVGNIDRQVKFRLFKNYFKICVITVFARSINKKTKFLYQGNYFCTSVDHGNGVSVTALLFIRETVSLFLHFTVNPKPPVGFLDVPRCSMTGKEQTVCRSVHSVLRTVRIRIRIRLLTLGAGSGSCFSSLE
jgi:hypothetical protein